MRRLPISPILPRHRHLLAALVLAFSLAACGPAERTGGGGAPEAQVYTHFTPQAELFVEFSPLVAGGKSTFAAHFTRLADYRPVTEGTVDVVLSGGGARGGAHL